MKFFPRLIDSALSLDKIVLDKHTQRPEGQININNNLTRINPESCLYSGWAHLNGAELLDQHLEVEGVQEDPLAALVLNQNYRSTLPFRLALICFKIQYLQIGFQI